MTPTPGDTGGDCPRCGEPTTLVGAGHSVVGTWCRACDLLVPLQYHDVRLLADDMEWDPDDAPAPRTGDRTGDTVAPKQRRRDE